MPTVNKPMNKVYVKKSKDKRKEAIGVEVFNKFHALETAQYRLNERFKAGEEEYKKKQNEYMKQYRAQKKAIKNEGKNEKANILQNAFRNRLARKAVLNAKFSKANEVLSNIKQERTDNLKKKLIATVATNDILNDLFPTVLNNIELPKRRGRPKKYV
jgi:hypothetical protein